METVRIARPTGEIAVDVYADAGPLVLCIPGMGETRASFRHLAPRLAEHGLRVAVMDLRGHGESSTTFDAYDDPAAASDALAVIEALGGGPATLIGNSMGAAAAVIAAAEEPQLVERLVLIGPFVRDHGPAVMRLLLRLALARPWGRALWRKYYRSLFGVQRPADHEGHIRATTDLLRQSDRWRAFQATTRTSHAPAEAALPRVEAPTLVVMGDGDPDFKDPAAEAAWVAGALKGEYRMVAGAGHYPMAEQPEVVLPMLDAFLGTVLTHG